jgi:hypothetical protein
MTNSKKLLAVLVLSSVSSLGSSAVAFARETDEDLAARAASYESRQSAQAESSPSEASDYETAAVKGGLIVYSPGVANGIVAVSRFKNYLFVMDQFEHSSRLVPYFTERGARKDFARLAAGASLDVSSCMSDDRELSTSIDAETGCFSGTYTQKVDCSRFNSVPVLTWSEAMAYGDSAKSESDIDATPLSATHRHCPQQGPKF